MGKSNRIRTQKANATLAGVKPAKKSNGMPSWAINLITIAVTVVIFLSVILSVMSSNGVFMRMQTAMKTDNFRVNGNMMTYYFQTQYSSFVSENSSYLSYLGLDTGVSLKDQVYSTDTNSAEITWFDTLMDQTEAQVKEILVFCEEAHKRGIELDETDIANIDAEIEMYEMYAEIYGYTTNSYIASIYGKGMKASDIRNCLELSSLASKCSELIGEELENAITSDRIDAEYDKNKLDYNLVDLSYYTISVSFDEACEAVLGTDDYEDEDVEAKSAEIVAKYKEMIADAKAEAEELAKKTDIKDFNDYIITNIIEKAYDEVYDSELADSEDVTEDKLPSAENIAALRTKIIAHIKDLVENDKTYETLTVTADGKTTVLEVEVTTEYAELIEHAIEHALEDIKTDKETYISEGVAYDDTDDAIEWAFDDATKAGDIKSFEDGDGADGEELSEDLEELASFEISVYHLTKTQYRDEALTKDLGIMVFGTEADAKAAIEKLAAGVTLETFESVCTEAGGTFTDYENYSEGTMGVDAFDEWLYSDTTTAGTYTATPIKLDDSSYAVALYVGEGEAEWYVTVKSAILSEDFTARTTELTNTYAVTVKDKVLNKVDA
ncbi:MAG: hypothetical protein IJY08_04145 [Clostridia bacterium]|nr:hypothetical protein [Clostridia bacterium]